jgi:hypothetical protein
MSPELVVSLIGVLKEQIRAFDGLRAVMARSRGAFVSLGAPRLEAGLQGIESHAQKLADLEFKRGKIVEKLQQQLRLSGSAQVSRIAPLLPDNLGRSLRYAAAAAAEAARRMRIECQVGSRLLRLSEEANIGIIESLLGVRNDHRGGNASYDRNARSQSTEMPGGNIISGTA